MSDTNKAAGVPAQPLAPGNFDKAWNDPPLFSYSAGSGQQATAGRLNKRVAFPSQPSSVLRPGLDPTAPPKLYDAGMKPPSSGCVGPPPPPSGAVASPPPPPAGAVASPPPPPAGAAGSAGQSEDSETVQHTLLETCDKYLDTDIQQDVKARLEGLFRDWSSGGLNPDIQQTLRDLAGCLAREDTEGAEASFTKLTADWSSVIGPSNIMAIKKILYAAKLALRTDEQDGALTKPL